MKPPQMPDRKFVERAVADADVNVLRMALFQATRDPDIAAVHAERVAGMVADTVVFSDDDTDLIRSKAVEYLMSGDLADEAGCRRTTRSPISSAWRRPVIWRPTICSCAAGSCPSPRVALPAGVDGHEVCPPEATRSRSSGRVLRDRHGSPACPARHSVHDLRAALGDRGECGASTPIPTSVSTRSVRRTSTPSRRSTRGRSTSRASPRYAPTSTTSHASTACTSTSSSTRM